MTRDQTTKLTNNNCDIDRTREYRTGKKEGEPKKWKIIDCKGLINSGQNDMCSPVILWILLQMLRIWQLYYGLHAVSYTLVNIVRVMRFFDHKPITKCNPVCFTWRTYHLFRCMVWNDFIFNTLPIFFWDIIEYHQWTCAINYLTKSHLRLVPHFIS